MAVPLQLTPREQRISNVCSTIFLISTLSLVVLIFYADHTGGTALGGKVESGLYFLSYWHRGGHIVYTLVDKRTFFAHQRAEEWSLILLALPIASRGTDFFLHQKARRRARQNLT